MAKQTDKYDRFLWQAGEFTISPLCELCTYLRQNNICKAFPEGIPDAILTWEHDHHKPYKGDHGIQYKAIGKAKTEMTVSEFKDISHS